MHSSIVNALAKQNNNPRDVAISDQIGPDVSWDTAFANNQKQLHKTRDNLLHHATGNVHNVAPAGHPSYNRSPHAQGRHTQQRMQPDSSNGSGSGNTGHGKNGPGHHNTHGDKQKGVTKQWLKRFLNRSGGGGGNQYPKLLGNFGGVPSLGSVPAGSVQSTSSGPSPVLIIILVVAAAGGGFLLIHKFRKAGAEEKDMGRKGQ